MRCRRAAPPRPTAVVRGIEAGGVAEEQLAMEGAHVCEAQMLGREALLRSSDTLGNGIVRA